MAEKPSADFPFRMRIPVRITDIAGGLHVGNQHMVGYLTEAHSQLVRALGFPELTVDGAFMINGRLEVDYLSEARYGEIMDIGVAVDSFEQRRYQAAFEIADEATGRAVCRARMRMVFIDAQRHERRDVPESFVVAYRRLEARAGSPGA